MSYAFISLHHRHIAFTVDAESGGASGSNPVTEYADLGEPKAEYCRVLGQTLLILVELHGITNIDIRDERGEGS
jgi:hypothetical protein